MGAIFESFLLNKLGFIGGVKKLVCFGNGRPMTAPTEWVRTRCDELRYGFYVSDVGEHSICSRI